MLRKMFSYFTLPLLLLLSNSTKVSLAQPSAQNQKLETGTLEKMIASNGVVAMDLNWSQLNGNALKPATLRFAVNPDSFFTALVFNNMFRGIDGGSMSLASKSSAILPAPLNASINQLVVEKGDSTAAFDLMVRDGKTGFTFFNIAGHSYDYDANKHVLKINDGRLLISNEFATRLGNSSQSNSVAGKISITMTMYPIEIDKLVNGTVQSAVMPPMQPSAGTNPWTRCHRR